MSSAARHILDASDKRIATLQKSLEKKRKALQVQEEMLSQEPQQSLEDHPTYIYYQKELQAAEEAYEKKCRYYNDAIDALKEKLKATKPTGKVYRRLVAEVEMEDKELKRLLAEHSTLSTTIRAKEVEQQQQKALERIKEEERKEQELVAQAKEAARLRQEAERAEEDRRAKERSEEAKKLYAIDTNSIISDTSKESKNSHTPSTPLTTKTQGYLQMIKEATTIKKLDDIYTASKGKFTDEEDALWEERFQALEDKETKVHEEAQETQEAPVVSQESEAFQHLMNMPRAVINSQKGADLFNTLESPQEMKKVLERMHALNSAAQPKAPPFVPPQPVAENSIVSMAPILKTTKMAAKQVGVRPPQLRPL
jgi:hypothetical protein